MSLPKRTRTPLRRLPLHRLDLDGAFFWLLLVFLLTVVAFFSLRDRHIQLDATQVAEYERRSQFLSNSTVYLVEVSRAERAENLLSKLSPVDWAKISTEIDYVAFIYDDLPLFLTEDWVKAAEDGLEEIERVEKVKKGVGIGVFGCGCVLPNEYFRRVEVRLQGYECVLLPGWVLPMEDVVWLDVKGGEDSCRRRGDVLASRMAARFAKELKEIYGVMEEIRREIEEGKKKEGIVEGGSESMGEGVVEVVNER